MDSTTKQEFTRRITTSNKSGLVVIMYEIYFTYIDEAKKSKKNDDHDGFKENIRHAGDVLVRLKDDLNFKYSLSSDLYRLYTFAQLQLSISMTRYSEEELDIAKDIIYPLWEAFSQVAKEDDSAPMMRNIQEVYAGMTYGRGTLTEDVMGNANRGFLA